MNLEIKNTEKNKYNSLVAGCGPVKFSCANCLRGLRAEEIRKNEVAHE